MAASGLNLNPKASGGTGSVGGGGSHQSIHSSRLLKSPPITGVTSMSQRSQRLPSSTRAGHSCTSEAATDSAAEMLEFAEAILSEAHRFTLPHTGAPVRVRVGIHTGRVTSGVIGVTRRKFTILGSTVSFVLHWNCTSMM